LFVYLYIYVSITVKQKPVTGRDGSHVAKGWGCYSDDVVAVPVARHWSVRPTLTVARLPIRDASIYRCVVLPPKRKFWRELTS